MSKQITGVAEAISVICLERRILSVCDIMKINWVRFIRDKHVCVNRRETVEKTIE